MDEAELALVPRLGADEMARHLVENYAQPLYHYCLAMLPDSRRAEDALCNTLLAAIDRFGKLTDPDRLELWLLALARNECLRIQRATQPADELADPPAPLTEDGGFEEIAELIHVHGLDHRGVAAVLGITAYRARRLAQRAETAVLEGRVAPARDNLPPVPERVVERIRSDTANPGRTMYHGELAKPLRRNGFPVPLDRPNQRRRLAMMTAVVVGLVAIGVVHALPFGDRGDVVLTVGEPTGADQPLILTPSSASPSGSTSPTASSSASPSSSPSKTASVSASPTRPAPTPTIPQPRSPAPNPQQPPPAPAPRAPAPPSGQITGIWNGCLEVVGGGGVELRGCNGGDAQHWTVATDGTLRAFGLCLSTVGGGTANRTRVVLANCDGSDVQQWYEGANGSVRNGRSGTCMDGPNRPEDPRTVEIWYCTGGEYQRWNLPG
jgi:hypothetical protein